MHSAKFWFFAGSAFLLPLCVAAGAMDRPSARAPRYQLVMSADDSVCKPLVEVYSADLGTLRHRHGRATHGLRTTDFEATLPESFAQRGFMPIASADSAADPDLVVKRYSLDLFGEGKPRTVVIIDKIGDNYRSSELYVLKPGAHYRRVAVMNASQPGIFDWYIDPSTVADIPGESVSVSQRYHLQAYRGYVLTKWPGFDILYRRSISGAHGAALPMLDDVLSIRPVKFMGSVYFIQNQYARLPLRPSHRSIVVVERLHTTGRDDVCYIAVKRSPTRDDQP